MHEIQKQIRTDLRLSMNGVVSQSMREKGMDYKLNFGVDIPRLRKIAQRYQANSELASALWKQETRELKILATLLFPADDFDAEKAEEWAKEIPNQEIREQVCMNLFQKLSYADKLVKNWTNSTDEETRTTGYWLYARLLLTKPDLAAATDANSLSEKMISDLNSDSYFLRLSAQNALKFLGRTHTELSRKILSEIQSYRESENPVKNEIYQSLSFEFNDFLD